jgi:NADH-quinone oxidoreductase subunit L
MKVNILSLLFILPVLILIAQAITYPFLRLRISEKIIKFTTKSFQIISIIASIFLICLIKQNESVELFSFISVKYSFQNALLSLYSLVLLFSVTHFSFDYIHKEIGFYKFFLNFSLFWLGQLLLIWGNSHFFIFAGWEFIGISSIFLIAFYDYRIGPVKNSIIVMSYYKFADIILITSLLLLSLHNKVTGVDFFENLEYIALIGILLSGLIKSGSFPFTGWLPKAMEGPTPSSAIYYVALSVNTGIIILFKYSDQLLEYNSIHIAFVIFGLFTIFYSSFLSRVQTDAKNSLVYASSIQTGFVLIEIGLGFHNLAIIHMISTSIIKTFQFLRSPSYLYIYHHMQGHHGKVFDRTGIHFENLIPNQIRGFIYMFSFHNFFLDDLINDITFAMFKLSSLLRKILSPIISFDSRRGWQVLYWLVFYISSILIVNFNSILLQDKYVGFIPFFLLLISISLLFIGNVYEFVAAFTLYKIIENIIVHAAAVHVPFKLLGMLVVAAFTYSVIYKEKLKERKSRLRHRVFVDSFILFMMLYFTNFPFLLQSLTNEHLLEYFIINNSPLELIVYCVSNTFFNIGIYKFIFEYIYLDQKRGKYEKSLEE